MLFVALTKSCLFKDDNEPVYHPIKNNLDTPFDRLLDSFDGIFINPRVFSSAGMVRLMNVGFSAA